MGEHVAAGDDPRGAQHSEGTSTTPAEPAHRANRPVDSVPPKSRRSRRVTTEPPPGSDPNPEPEEQRHGATENDEQLKRDVPPHWG